MGKNSFRDSRVYRLATAAGEFKRLSEKSRSFATVTEDDIDKAVLALRLYLELLDVSYDERERTKLVNLIADIDRARCTGDGRLVELIIGKAEEMLDLMLHPLGKRAEREYVCANRNQLVFEHRAMHYFPVPRRFICHIQESCAEGKLSASGDMYLYRYLVLYSRAAVHGDFKILGNSDFSCGEYSLIIPAFGIPQHRESLESLFLPSPGYRNMNRKEKLEILKKIMCEMQEHGFISYTADREVTAGNPVFVIHIKHAPVSKGAGRKGAYRYSGYVLLKRSLVSRLMRQAGKNSRASEADMLLDMWVHTVTVDPFVRGSLMLPVVCFPSEKKRKIYKKHGLIDPRLQLEELAGRWHISRATAARKLDKFAAGGFIHHYFSDGGDRSRKWGHLLSVCGFAEIAFVNWSHPESRKYKSMRVNELPVPTPFSMSLILEMHGCDIHDSESIQEESVKNALNMKYRGKETVLYDLDFLDQNLVESYSTFETDFSKEAHILSSERSEQLLHLSGKRDCNESSGAGPVEPKDGHEIPVRVCDTDTAGMSITEALDVFDDILWEKGFFLLYFAAGTQAEERNAGRVHSPPVSFF